MRVLGRIASGASWRVVEKSTRDPSRVKSQGTSPVEWWVRRLASPPCDDITNTSRLPWRSDANAIRAPSWDQTGRNSSPSWEVRRVAAPPSTGTVQRSPR